MKNNLYNPSMTVQNGCCNDLHTFHIPVMGLGFSIDTPIKVARFGVSSVVSVMEDHLIERMRELHSRSHGFEYIPISVKDDDYRARRITAYLDLMGHIVERQMDKLKKEPFVAGNDIATYFESLPENSAVRTKYECMQSESDAVRKARLQSELRQQLIPGSIDVNIMTKLDRLNYSESGEELPPEFSDASSALRGFAKSRFNSSVVFSAGMNPRLFAYCTTFDEFFPDKEGKLAKKIILKVSDFRSAAIQGKFLAKKGLWVSEFRIESGLNCGGHAFATDGSLMGPILEEFKTRRSELSGELYDICSAALEKSGRFAFKERPAMKVTAQGGVGTYHEHDFLIQYYRLDSVGWGSPFLLVPEVTNVDDETLGRLSKAKREDYFLSNSSPLGVPFNNFRNSSSEEQRLSRISKGRPGSPCYKKFLAFNTEFGPSPLCTASRQYQDLKIKQAKAKAASAGSVVADQELSEIAEKDCLCEGLGASALIKNGIDPPHKLKAVTICPGPNLAYFTGVFSMSDMIGHIYGRKNLLNTHTRPHMFINELLLNIDYLKSEQGKYETDPVTRKPAQLELFRENLMKGIDYYRSIIQRIKLKESGAVDQFLSNLAEAAQLLTGMQLALHTK